MNLLLVWTRDHCPSIPGQLIQGKELNVRSVLPEPLPDLEQQFSLVDLCQFTQEGTVLDTLKPVIQAGIGNFASGAIMGDIINQ
jgi:hypothetical protein